jgi:micrococcal nuclease
MRHGFLAALLCWTVTAQPIRAVDGDTVEAGLEVHLGTVTRLNHVIPEKIRVLGIDTPERGQPGYEEATAFTQAWIMRGPFTVSYCRRDSLLRVLGLVTRDGEDLTQELIRAGLGVAR